MGKFCSNCGKELTKEQNVCLKCGVITKNIIQSNEKDDKCASVGLILGLISIVAWIIPLFGYPTTICGIVFSSKGLNSISNKGKTIAGLVLSIIFLVLTLINSIAGAIITVANYY